MPLLTYEVLSAAGSCVEKEEFTRFCGKELELTPEVAEQYALKFDVPWLIIHVLEKNLQKMLLKELATHAKEFTSRESPEFKRFLAKLAAKYYGMQQHAVFQSSSD